ncbi:MAG: SoxR reducing system RseC family protein [Gammaproteobacteria bacterium]
MIEETAIVSRIDNGRIWIKTRHSGACCGCLQQDSCGTKAMAGMLPNREFAVDCATDIKVGDEVRIAIDDSELLLGSLLLYLLPLLVLLTGVGAADALLPLPMTDTWLPEIALAILLLTFRLIHLFQKRLLLHFCLKPMVIADIRDKEGAHPAGEIFSLSRRHDSQNRCIGFENRPDRPSGFKR